MALSHRTCELLIASTERYLLTLKLKKYFSTSCKWLFHTERYFLTRSLKSIFCIVQIWLQCIFSLVANVTAVGMVHTSCSLNCFVVLANPFHTKMKNWILVEILLVQLSRCYLKSLEWCNCILMFVWLFSAEIPCHAYTYIIQTKWKRYLGGRPNQQFPSWLVKFTWMYFRIWSQDNMDELSSQQELAVK